MARAAAELAKAEAKEKKDAGKAALLRFAASLTADAGDGGDDGPLQSEDLWAPAAALLLRVRAPPAPVWRLALARARQACARKRRGDAAALALAAVASAAARLRQQREEEAEALQASPQPGGARSAAAAAFAAAHCVARWWELQVKAAEAEREARLCETALLDARAAAEAAAARLSALAPPLPPAAPRRAADAADADFAGAALASGAAASAEEAAEEGAIDEAQSPQAPSYETDDWGEHWLTVATTGPGFNRALLEALKAAAEARVTGLAGGLGRSAGELLLLRGRG